jgi:hypothetical protein
MTALEQADALAQEAIELLLAERQRIDDRLAQLGDKKSPDKRRGRPPKAKDPLTSGLLCTTERIES